VVLESVVLDTLGESLCVVPLVVVVSEVVVSEVVVVFDVDVELSEPVVCA
jgi:hypothetical protein